MENLFLTEFAAFTALLETVILGQNRRSFSDYRRNNNIYAGDGEEHFVSLPSAWSILLRSANRDSPISI